MQNKKMAKRPLMEFILLVINLVFTVCGLGILCYGLDCFFNWKLGIPKEIHEGNTKYMIVHRLLLAIDPPKASYDTLPKAWFIYLVIGIGAILVIISCFGYVGIAKRSPCCLIFYCVFLGELCIIELGTAVFTFFDHSWKEVIPENKSDNYYHTVYHFVNDNWKVIKWVALAVFVLQVIATILAIYLRSVFNRALYDRIDDEPVVYLPRARTHNYRMVVPTAGKTPSTTTSANARDPTKATNTNTNTNTNAKDPTKATK